MPKAMPANALQLFPAFRDAPVRASPLRSALPLALVYYSFLLFSPEVAINPGGFYLPLYRLVLLALAIPAMSIVIKRAGGGPNFIDVVVAATSCWIILSFTLNYGLGAGLVRGGGVLVDIGLSYLVARASISTFTDLRYLLMMILPGLFFAGFTLALESLSGRLLLRPAFVSVFGSATSFVTDGGSSAGIVTETRLGLLRAYGPFGHPILAGVVMVSLLPLYYFSRLRSWPYLAGILVALSGFFSLSSATFLCLAIAAGAICIDAIKAYFNKLTWWTISGFMIFVLWAAHVASQNGMVAVLARLTLTPHTAQYRMQIWEWGARTIEKHPWFGIGYKSWDRLPWMHDSVDAHFLLLGMRHGVIVPVLLVLAVVYGVIRLGRCAPMLRKIDRDLAVGINICMILLLIVGQTVAFFGSAQIAFMAFLAILASIVNCAQMHVDYARSQERHAALMRRSGALVPQVTSSIHRL